jgi:hypothetical protein
MPDKALTVIWVVLLTAISVLLVILASMPTQPPSAAQTTGISSAR